jgi:transposase
MSIIGGFDVHRRQITFDYVDTDTGRLYRGRIGPACRGVLRRWLAERFAGRSDVAFAVEACTGWRFVVEELEYAGIAAHLAETADTSTARGRKKRAKSDAADAALQRRLLAEGRLPESWIPPEQVREIRAILELYKDLRDEHTAWVQRVHAILFHHGVPQLGTGGVATAAGRARVEVGEGLSAAGRQAVTAALRVMDALDAELTVLYRQIRSFANRQPGCKALQAQYGVGPITSAAVWAMWATPAGSRPPARRCATPAWT